MPAREGRRERERVRLIFSPCVLLLWSGETNMETIYKVAGIDVHKKMLAVMITDARTGG
jgi:hypothetical protein